MSVNKVFCPQHRRHSSLRGGPGSTAAVGLRSLFMPMRFRIELLTWNPIRDLRGQVMAAPQLRGFPPVPQIVRRDRPVNAVMRMLGPDDQQIARNL